MEEDDYMLRMDPMHSLSLQFMEQSPPIDRNDGPVAAVISDRITHAADLWDDTLEDLAGYLRMMGSLITGYLEMREIMPETQEIRVKYKHLGGISAIFNVFLAGQTGKSKGYTTGSIAGDEEACRKLQHYDPAIRDVVSACATLKLTMVLDGSKGSAAQAGDLFKIALDKLQGYDDKEEVARIHAGANGPDENGLYANEKLEALTAKRLSYLQQAVEDQLGVTRDELNLEDVFFYCQWRFGSFVLGLDSKYPPQLWNQSPAGLNELGMKILHVVIHLRPQYFPPAYDRARYMASNPSFYTPHDVVNKSFPGYAAILLSYHHSDEEAGRSWAQLQMQCTITRAGLAGGLRLPRPDASSGQQEVENDMEYFTAEQVLPHVERAEELLDILRPWLGDNEELQKLDKEVKGWREKYLNGKDENELQKSVPMNGDVTSQGASGVGEKKVRTCASCGTSSNKLKACSSCKQVWYCNAVCQKAGWKAHKKACIASRKNA